jgi:hypothetical protein
VGIERTEHYARQAAARKIAQERGFSALVAWSRGGSTQDHYADVYYLTDHRERNTVQHGARQRKETDLDKGQL